MGLALTVEEEQLPLVTLVSVATTAVFELLMALWLAD